MLKHAYFLIPFLVIQCAYISAQKPANCSCDDFHENDVDAGAIWPAYGHVVYNYPNDNENLQPTSYYIVPPADCAGSNCWRANITCSFNSKFIENFNVDEFLVSWNWFWEPTVQYPLGMKNWTETMEKNGQLIDDSYVRLPTNSEINSMHENSDLFANTICPTNYTQNIKFCPINTFFQEIK